MLIALHTVIAASKKEPLAEMSARIRQAFLDAGLGEPVTRFTFTDAPTKKGLVVIDRVCKRHPEMEPFRTQRTTPIGVLNILSNYETGDPAPVATLESILAGVPRSYPFRAVAMHFYAPQFGERLIGLPAAGHSFPGVLITDNAWVNGRQRSLSVYTSVEVRAEDKKLPPNSPAVDAVIKACGRARKAVQVPIRAPGGRPGELVGSIPLENIEAVKAVNESYRARIRELVVAAALPHTLPPIGDALDANRGVLAGPRKPALVAAFEPMGYSCTGGTGVFHLSRRTQGNHIAELYLDVGTWSHMVSANFSVHGAGFRASLGIPVAAEAYGQYPIGDAAQWQKIVENLAAMVYHLDTTFVSAVEQAAGPSPAWYQPSI
jgi:hypothetical protein